MKLVFLVITILINLFNHSPIKSEDKINLGTNITENISKKESNNENKNENKTIHIVKSGETLSSISKLYSINKDLIIKLNNLKDQNYIYVGQNLIISESTENSLRHSVLNNSYHIVKTGENLTDISNKYDLKIGYLLEINNLNDPDSIKVGEKLLLKKNNPIDLENHEIINNKELFKLDKNIYGPIIIENKSFETINGRKILNVINQKNKKLFISIKCDTNELDVRIPGRKWRGWEPAKEEFEINLINDFCQNF